MQLLNLDLLNTVLPGSHADRKPGLSGANYVGEKLPFSVSNAQLLREPVQRHYHCASTSHEKARFLLHEHSPADCNK